MIRYLHAHVEHFKYKNIDSDEFKDFFLQHFKKEVQIIKKKIIFNIVRMKMVYLMILIGTLGSTVLVCHLLSLSKYST